MIPVEPDDGHDAPLGGTFVRPGAIVWGRSGADEDPYVPAEVIEQILLTVAKDPDRVTDLLDDLARARLWLPLPAADRPVELPGQFGADFADDIPVVRERVHIGTVPTPVHEDVRQAGL